MASSSSSKQKPFVLLLLFLSFTLFILVLSFKPKPNLSTIHRVQYEVKNVNPNGFDLIAKEIITARKFKVGLVNVDDSIEIPYDELFGLSKSETTESVKVDFDRVDENSTWNKFFPEWIDEEEKDGPPKCPEIPMPRFEDYQNLDIVVARVPCGEVRETEGIRDLFRLQVNLVVANLVVRSGWVTPGVHRTVYVAFIGSCGPMLEIFRCDDLLMHHGDYWVYKPELRRLKLKMVMPVGSCQLANTGKEVWRNSMSQQRLIRKRYYTKYYHQREAYATVLHSSEEYVCGAIALAQSILQSNTTRDLVLLADDSITPKSIRGLRAAGWKIKRIQRVRSPFSVKGSYNEWNYSKLRVWQLIEYDKVIFIDADLLVLKNIDNFFFHPQLSAAPNDGVLFNSGVVVIEPSMCMFEDLMSKRLELRTYNGGDQGFLNEVFTWWHRLPRNLNYLKIFEVGQGNEKHEMSEDVYAIHYLGLKPWKCYKDYDCNWDMLDHHPFASDSAHKKWWKVYETMPKKLQQYCGLTQKMDARIRKWRRIARNASLPDGHWRIEAKDPRKNHYVG